MRHTPYFLFIFFCIACFCMPLKAQQNQELKRSKTIFLYPEFQDGKVRQSFGRYAKAKVNIFLKDASLCFINEEGTIMKAYTKGIFGVEFPDSSIYMKVDSAMAKVIAQKDYNYLLCVTSVNMKRYREETTGGSELPFFEMSDFGIFLQMDGQQREEDYGLPLQDKYYFSVKGNVIPANESDFKKVMDPEQKQAFKVLMTNRFWSWNDPENLTMLLDFLPK